MNHLMNLCEKYKHQNKDNITIILKIFKNLNIIRKA